ncbi:xanthine dehydrogenase family protein molybdopterin-binding subunit [Paralimibaculum aggregatum]|uniref:Xanthine dehydrogenase family protein molybdopterin-binding subunit n=1 Tax=Paralimibaculum aggregatum TaxID=3036245 RepID=A0ABQ6LGA8_9RHOB|nr:xanthine dehydrogenase family protein molybdopterin-binding subunit [Limibaculum sp. NKW23]GMG81245.1 xanthine dehydrogenase family protein molybdopterin-binding subunit [Limibaculum sp. NKW23]
MKFGIGQPVRRAEDDRLVRGRGRYVSDIVLPGQAVAALRRSDVAHGRLRAVAADAARAMPGVLAVYTHADIAGRLVPLGNEFPMDPPPAPVTVPHLADTHVRFVGQPIAFVVAETREAAEAAAEAIEVEIEELPAVVDPLAALAPGAPELHPEAPGNLAYDWHHGDAAEVAAIFAGAAHVVQAGVTNQRVAVAPMEPRAIAVAYDPAGAEGQGRWEAWVGCQGAHGMRGRMAVSLGVAPERIRVRVPDVGGGFGMKLMTHPEYALAALAAKDLGRPVAWVADRSESFLSDAQGRDMRGRVEGAFDAAGRILALRMDTVSGLGAQYSSVGVAVHTVFSAVLLGGMYRVPRIHARVRGAFLNTTPTDAYRGAGRPETIHATERLMDAAARALGLDRAEIRRRNLVTPAMLPHTTDGGFTFDSLDTHAVLDRALAAADWAGFEARRAAEAETHALGIGITYYMERTGGGPVETARVEVTPEGGARIWVGTQSNGQGHATAWAQILHEETGLPFERIALMEGDSDALPAGGGTGGSRSAKMASRVILLAAGEIREKGRALAAEHLEAAPSDIEFDAAASAFRIAGTDRSVSLAALAAEAGGIEGAGAVDGRASTFPNGCHIAEIAIERATGRAALRRYTVVDDFGRLINPEIVAGQVHGGVVQGIGQVLMEAARWDPETGQPLTGSFMDYAMPRAADLPRFAVEFLEVPARTNPLGVKGCGEAGAVGGISATASAVADALAAAGAAPETVEPPYTAETLWRALNRRA